MYKMKKSTLLLALALPVVASAQDDLIKKLDGNHSDSSKKKFTFTHVIDLEKTSVKNQGGQSLLRSAWLYKCQWLLCHSYQRPAVHYLSAGLSERH